jgi:hypothetical protein
MRRFTLFAAIAAPVFLLAGCVSTPPPSAPPPAAAANPSPSAKLYKGMPAAAVRELLGKPARITMVVTSEGMVDEWTYHLRYERIGQEATSMESRPVFVGPGRGDANGIGTIEVPAYSMVTYQVDETVKLLLFQGKVLEWKSSATEKRTYN